MISEHTQLIATAASLAMDAFSVSICLGLCHGSLKLRQAFSLGGAFGFFQFIMPLFGSWIAKHISGFFDGMTPWIAASLILWVAFKMVKEAYLGADKTNSCMIINFKNIVILAFATSLDALAVGYSISSTGGMAAELAITAGMITFFLSLFGALAGRKLGKKTGDRAEYFGGAVLFLIAAKIIVSAVS
ncbi:MAG: manganese efflux pump MntP family protein [Synergistaceae bacterium]|nr:manganese efflux pump MntP family protein [Synergistaceae bacterium]